MTGRDSHQQQYQHLEKTEFESDLFTTGVRHHAVRAVFVAAFHDGDEGGRAISARLWQTVKFLDLREAHVNHRATAAANLINHLWQAVQGLRAKNDIHIGGSLADQLTFLRCDAATHANDQVRIFRLRSFQRPNT